MLSILFCITIITGSTKQQFLYILYVLIAGAMVYGIFILRKKRLVSLAENRKVSCLKNKIKTIQEALDKLEGCIPNSSCCQAQQTQYTPSCKVLFFRYSIMVYI